MNKPRGLFGRIFSPWRQGNAMGRHACVRRLAHASLQMPEKQDDVDAEILRLK